MTKPDKTPFEDTQSVSRLHRDVVKAELMQMMVSAPPSAKAEISVVPTALQLHRMAYILKLFPEGAAVPVQVMEILQDQWRAVVKANEPVQTSAVGQAPHASWYATGSGHAGSGAGR